MSNPSTNSCVIQSDSYLTLHYRLALANGSRPFGAVEPAVAESANDLVSTFGQRPATLQMGSGQLSAPLESHLMGLKVGDHLTFELPAGEAFGPRNPELIQKISRSLLDKESESGSNYQPGDVVEFRKSANGSDGERVAAVLKELNDQFALFDFNHPLAGQPVQFEVEIIGVL